jgi:hypothetical protein
MKKEMKKETVISVARFLEIALFLLAMIAFLAWINNIVIAMQWDPSKIKPIEAKVMEGGTKEAKPADAKAKVENANSPRGFIHPLDRFAVDYSTVSTFIVFFGFLLLSFRFYQIAHAKNGTDVPDNFPSFKHYNTITVTLGLIGTIWGLIMVGNYDLETLTNPDLMMPELMKCMKTALYSTLVALFWIFVVIYPASWIMPAAYRRVSGYKSSGDANIISILGELGSATKETIIVLKEMPKELERIKKDFTLVSDLLVKTDKNGKQEGILPDLKTVIVNLNDATIKQKETTQNLQTLLGSFSAQLENADQRAEKAEKKMNQSNQVSQSMQDVANSIQKLLGKMDEWKKG